MNTLSSIITCPACGAEAVDVAEVSRGDRLHDIFGCTFVGIFREYNRICRSRHDTRADDRKKVPRDGYLLYLHNDDKTDNDVGLGP